MGHYSFVTIKNLLRELQNYCAWRGIKRNPFGSLKMYCRPRVYREEKSKRFITNTYRIHEGKYLWKQSERIQIINARDITRISHMCVKIFINLCLDLSILLKSHKMLKTVRGANWIVKCCKREKKKRLRTRDDEGTRGAVIIEQEFPAKNGARFIRWHTEKPSSLSNWQVFARRLLEEKTRAEMEKKRFWWITIRWRTSFRQGGKRHYHLWEDQSFSSLSFHFFSFLFFFFLFLQETSTIFHD